MEKAVQEGKINLSWINPNSEYTGVLRRFVARILSPGTAAKPNNFLRLMYEFIPRLAWFGAMNSLSQTLLKLTSPGVPDIYQGQELFDFSLVDPDNRRPVDFGTIKKYLSGLAGREASPELCRELLESWTDGRLKLWTTHRVLQKRGDARSLFRHGDYASLAVEGERSENIVAFVRRHKQRTALVAAPRLLFTMLKGEPRLPRAEDWADTRLHVPRELSGRAMTNAFTGESMKVQDNGDLLCSEVLAGFPVALLID
jgi:(1->4)-alpha-D-glucan 1-alpha-D-glucosylmutase